eukprot:TRINITY_DN26794_c0_g1_i1.p1 TRINITY_DN26794_c0_g1~~TRINITY_DN26794_c0_g1_i1.p1  ORF type:complete len:227 (-),score=18.78 TRINITY_DN26794_c0_g1_i1:302-982(-)
MDRGEEERSEAGLKKMVLTCVSAMLAETSTFPIDMTKTRLQLDVKSCNNALRVGLEIIQKQGLLGLYNGLSPAILRHAFYTPIRIVTYEHLRNYSSTASLSLSTKALFGGLSGAFAQVVASPVDLVKVRMQADSRLASQGLQPRYTGTIDALNKIVQTEGFSGLWRGVFPNVQRAFLVNMGELACYDHAKRFIISNRVCEDNTYAHTLASIMSGLSATTLSCPAPH